MMKSPDGLGLRLSLELECDLEASAVKRATAKEK